MIPMGVSLHCRKTNRTIDLGGGGFLRLRRTVADLCGEEVSAHYRLMLDNMFQRFESEAEKEAFWSAYDAQTEGLIRRRKLNVKVADFLYQSDCGGKIRYGACKNLLKVIGDYDDNQLYGYAGLPDCARFRDFTAILEDCVSTKSNLTWD